VRGDSAEVCKGIHLVQNVFVNRGAKVADGGDRSVRFIGDAYDYE